MLLVYVEGGNDEAFASRLLEGLGARCKHVEYDRVYHEVRWRMVSRRGSDCMIAEYAQRASYKGLLTMLARLAARYAVEKSREPLHILVLTDEDDAPRDAKLRALEEAARNTRIPGVSVEAVRYCGWCRGLRVERRSEAVLVAAVVECSLECQAARHVLGAVWLEGCDRVRCREAIAGRGPETFRALADALLEGRGAGPGGTEWFTCMLRGLRAMLG